MLKPDHQRIDKWLWHARIVLTRSDSAELAARGRVRLNGVRETSPGHGVKADDVLTVALDARVLVLKVTAFTERRGDAQAACGLYEDSAISGDLQRPFE
jgi:ribosome-associated heat shock protein Hsp15